jgi:amino acid transporter
MIRVRPRTDSDQALSETKNPVRTLKIAAPAAVGSVGIFYMLCNIAYFAAIPKQEFLRSGQIIAATFFTNMFGPKGGKAMSVFVALSAFGNVLSVIFSQGRSMSNRAVSGELALTVHSCPGARSRGRPALLQVFC